MEPIKEKLLTQTISGSVTKMGAFFFSPLVTLTFEKSIKRLNSQIITVKNVHYQDWSRVIRSRPSFNPES